MSRQVNLGARVAEETRDALARAAKDDLRSTASLVEKILVEWLRAKGYMGEPPKPSPVRRRKAETAPA